MFQRKPIISRSKSRNKQESDWSSKPTHLSSQFSSGNVEYCYDKTAEIVSSISKNIPIGDQKISFYNFSNKKTAFFLKLLFRERVFDSPANILFTKSKYFCQNSKLKRNLLCFISEKFSKMILWTSKIHFWEPCWKLSLEVVKNFARNPKRKTELNCFQKHIFFSQYCFSQFEKRRKFSIKPCWNISWIMSKLCPKKVRKFPPKMKIFLLFLE